MDYNAAFVKGIEKHFGFEWPNTRGAVEEIFHVDNMEGRYRFSQMWEGPGMPRRRMPGDDVAMDGIKENYRKLYTPAMWALGGSVFIEDLKDDIYGIIHRYLPAQGGMWARSFRTNREKLGAGFFSSYGYVSGNSVTGMADGKSLFNTAHPISRSQNATTVANRPSTDVDLSVAAADAAYISIGTQKEPNNETFIDNPLRTVVVHNSQGRVAYQVFKQPFDRGTANRDKNRLYDMDIKVILWPYFQKSGTTGTNNAWFCLAERHFLQWYDREAFTIDSQKMLQYLSYLVVGYVRLDFGADDWRGTYGSEGL